jgi:sugar-phosphatase
MRDDFVRVECEAILFDLDGVLVDSTACVEGSWRAWAATHGLDASVLLRAAHGRRALETVRFIAPHLDALAEVASLVAYESRAIEGIYEVPFARSLLRTLPPNRWGIVTSGVRSVAEHRLHHVNLPVPAVLICADDVEIGKPSPEGYLAAAELLGISPSGCLVIEDAPAGVEAAHAAGMRVIAIETTHTLERPLEADAIAAAFSSLTVHVHNGNNSLRPSIRVDIASGGN